MRAPNKQQTNQRKKKGIFFSGLLIIAAIAILSNVAQTLGQDHQKETGAMGGDLLASGLQSLSVWSILRMTDWLFWPFVFLTVSGILILTYKALSEFQDKSRSQLLFMKLVQMRDLRSLMDSIASSPSNRASRMFYRAVSTFYKTGRAEPIRDEAHQFLNSERDSFETFNRVVYFLSDTAGALGLLGTVWGIFATFHGGKLDGPTILQGMSVSLITTLVGLVISTVLNMGATGVFAMFNRQMKTLASQAEDIRQALLNLEKNAGAAPNNVQPQPQYEAQYQPAQQPPSQPQAQEFDINHEESSRYQPQTEPVQNNSAHQSLQEFEEQEPPKQQNTHSGSLLGDLMEHLPQKSEEQTQHQTNTPQQPSVSSWNGSLYQTSPLKGHKDKQSFFEPGQTKPPENEARFQAPTHPEPQQGQARYFGQQQGGHENELNSRPPMQQKTMGDKAFFEPQQSGFPQNKMNHPVPDQQRPAPEQNFFNPQPSSQNKPGNKGTVQQDEQQKQQHNFNIVSNGGWKSNGNGF